ncbi:MAG: hypothetical protein JWM04_1355 [Verrucomicrobiales bacterium]|nr:hypothetical protein [Verrucomicrobiales bacterium]
MRNLRRNSAWVLTGKDAKLHPSGSFGRRVFFRQVGAAILITQAFPFLALTRGAVTADSIVETTYGKIRGSASDGVHTFKGVHYGGTTEGKNRFMPPVKPAAWVGVKDALDFGPVAPQTLARTSSAESEDCLVLNIFTPSLKNGTKRPVMVWLHGGGFATGAASLPSYDGTNLALSNDVVVVTINHRLNVFGFTFLGQTAGSDFATSGAVGVLDIVAALEWVRDNISHFGGDPALVTIFGQSGGGRKVSTLMAMPGAQGLFTRAIIESGALLCLPTRDDGTELTELLMTELGLKRDQIRELQNVPVTRLLAANAEVIKKIPSKIIGSMPNSPVVDGTAIPHNPWDPVAPSLSASVPLLVGWTRTEETGFDAPTPESRAMDEAGLRVRSEKRLGMDPTEVIATYRKTHPSATPWELYIFITTDHPRGIYPRELAKRKVAQGAAPAYVYRFDWETPENGGHMHSPHSVEIRFVFNNIAAASPSIAKMPEAYTLAKKVSASWAAFARTGNPNIPDLPKWPEYSVKSRDTMLFNNNSMVEQDPDRETRLVMEKVLKLT